MFLNSLDNVIKKIVQQPEWENYRAYCQISQHWYLIVDRKAAKNTRPISFERKTLYIATSSAVWAQELALQRYSLIKKFNKKLNVSIKDIRFSPASWQKKPKQETIELPLQEVNTNQLRIEKEKSKKVDSELKITASDSVKKWLESIKQKSDTFINCPECNSSTPQTELKRWQVCRHCIAQKWNSEYRPPNN